MRVVFMGTPDFAVGSLKTLYDCGAEVALVVTRPDMPKGRGYVMTPSPVKSFALDHGTEVITPRSMRDPEVIEKLKSVGADLFVVTAFGKILPQEVLDIPALGCVNVHASLLPKLRGAAPINRAVMNGDAVGGVTLMYMDAGMDTGDMIIKKEVVIGEETDAGVYHDELMEAGSECLKEFLRMLRDGKEIPREKQDDAFATYAPKITNEETLIDFNRSNREVHDKIRGLSPFPGAYFTLSGKRIKAFASEMSGMTGEPGTVVSTDGGITVACGEGSVKVTLLQPEGKKPTDAESYLRGHRLETGVRLNG